MTIEEYAKLLNEYQKECSHPPYKIMNSDDKEVEWYCTQCGYVKFVNKGD